MGGITPAGFHSAAPCILLQYEHREAYVARILQDHHGQALSKAAEPQPSRAGMASPPASSRNREPCCEGLQAILYVGMYPQRRPGTVSCPKLFFRHWAGSGGRGLAREATRTLAARRPWVKAGLPSSPCELPPLPMIALIAHMFVVVCPRIFLEGKIEDQVKWVNQMIKRKATKKMLNTANNSTYDKKKNSNSKINNTEYRTDNTVLRRLRMIAGWLRFAPVFASLRRSSWRAGPRF